MAESVGTLVADLSLGGISQFQSGLKKAGTGFDKLGAAAKIAGGLIAGAIAFKAVQAFSEAVGAAIEFEKAIAEVGTLTNATAAETQALADNVSRLSAEFASPAVETAAALYQTISAGFSDAADSSAILNASLKLAVGGVTDTTTAVDGLTTILSAYQLDATQAGNVSDKLFVAMKAGKTTIGELSSSMGAVASIAATLGVSLEQTLAAVSALTTGGKKTSVAVTELRGAFVNILKPSAQAAELASALGIEFNAAALKSKGLAGFLEDVRQKTGGSTEAMSLLFGSVEAVGAVLGLTGPQMATFNKIQEDMGKSAGASEQAFSKMADTTDFKIKKLDEAWEGFKRTLADTVVPVVTVTVEALNDIVEGAGDAIGSLDKLGNAARATAKKQQALADSTLSLKERTSSAQDTLKEFGLDVKEVENLFSGAGDTLQRFGFAGVDGVEALEKAVLVLIEEEKRLADEADKWAASLTGAGKIGEKVGKAVADVLGGAKEKTKGLKEEVISLGEALLNLETEGAGLTRIFKEATAAAETARMAAATAGPGVDFAQGGLRGAFGPGPGGGLRGLGVTGEVAAGEGPGAGLKAAGDAALEAAKGASGLEEGLALFGAQVSGVSAALATGNLVGAAISLVASTGALDEVMASVSNVANALVTPFEDIFTAISVLVEIVADLVESALRPLIPIIQPLANLMVVLGELSAAMLEPMLMITNAFGALEPALSVLGSGINFVSKVISSISKGFLSVFIGVLKLVDKLKVFRVGDDIKRLEKARREIGKRESANEKAASKALEERRKAFEEQQRRQSNQIVPVIRPLLAVADAAEKVNEQFRQLPSGFKLRAAIFESLTSIAREPAPGQPGGVPLGPSLFEQERAQIAAAGGPGGLTEGVAAGPGINIESMQVVTPNANGFADDLNAIKERSAVVRTGSAAGNEAAFSGTPG